MPRFNYTCAITKALTIYTEMKKLNPSTVYNEMTIRESAPYRRDFPIGCAAENPTKRQKCIGGGRGQSDGQTVD